MRLFARFACVLVPCSFLFTACQVESDLDEYENEEEIATTEDALEGGACDLADAPWLFCDGPSVLENGQYAACWQLVSCPCDYTAWGQKSVTCQDGNLVDAVFVLPPPPGGEGGGVPFSFPTPDPEQLCAGTPLDCYGWNRGF